MVFENNFINHQKLLNILTAVKINCVLFSKFSSYLRIILEAIIKVQPVIMSGRIMSAFDYLTEFSKIDSNLRLSARNLYVSGFPRAARVNSGQSEEWLARGRS